MCLDNTGLVAAVCPYCDCAVCLLAFAKPMHGDSDDVTVQAVVQEELKTFGLMASIEKCESGDLYFAGMYPVA